MNTLASAHTVIRRPVMSGRNAMLGASLLAAASAFAGAATAAATPAPAADSQSAASVVSARWQKHQLRFDYNAFTSYYTCGGLEDKVKEILKYFGARPNVKVTVTGCPRPDAITDIAWVDVEFETLTAANGGTGADTVAATWQPVELRPNRPLSMGRGECEIVEKLKPVVTASFSLQDLDYRTSCIPHQVGLDDYAVHGKALQQLKGK